MLSTTNYKYKPWQETFDKEADVFSIKLNSKWTKMLSKIIENHEETINEEITKAISTEKNVYPYPKLIFNAFNLTNFSDVRVVILGQDPYKNGYDFNDKCIPEAMGLSFSVPIGIKIPPSLKNIFDNLKKYNHIKNNPSHGNLENWASQGCLMLNSSLTVEACKSNSHSYIWTDFTDDIIKMLSDKKDCLIFVLWGGSALEKLSLIDKNKHKLIISSHPSPLSCNNKLKKYPCFVDVDHFGLINQYIKEINDEDDEIDWNLD